MGKTWFTGCQHYSHKSKKGSIIEYENRPFKNIQEHDDFLISNHNSHVKKGDTVFFLGNFSFSDPINTKIILDSLNGEKFFIMGSNDTTITKNIPMFIGKNNRPIKWMRTRFDYLYRTKEGEFSEHGKKIVLDHYPMREWSGTYYDSWMLYSNTKGNLRNMPGRPSIDISVDSIAEHLSRFNVNGDKREMYRPISVDEVCDIMKMIKDSNYIMNKGVIK